MFKMLCSTARAIARVSLVPMAAISLLACEDTAALTRGKEDAMALAERLSAQAAKLTESIDGLAKRLAALPPGGPGVAELKAKIDSRKTALAALKDNLGAFPAKVDLSVKSGRAEELTRLASALSTEVAGYLTRLESDLPELGKRAADAERKAADDAAKAEAAKAAAGYARLLSTGYELKGASAGIESQLVAFVDDRSKAVVAATWFDFDRLTFKAGAAELDPDASKDQLQNTVEILKAYPKLKLKIGGYTDDVGAAGANKKLSLARAESVKKALGAAGVKAERLVAEGYGPEHPICPANDTEECRAKNRRIALRVTEK
jgi:outer membrane protein OmpA-like peptidoglycan-associated protein